MKRISEDEIRKLYDEYQTPPHVIAHCRAVAETAEKLGKALNEHGYKLDLNLIRSAGLSHDIARTWEDHGGVAADALERLGYVDEAVIVRINMKYSNFNPVEKLDECDLVCLADRLVKEDQYVGLDERINYILNKAPKKPEVIQTIMERKEETRQLLSEIEQVIVKTIDNLLQTQ